MADFKDLKWKVEDWANQRGLLIDSNTIKQYMKLVEEVAELGMSLAKNDLNGQIDGIGDCLVVLIILSKQLDLDIVNCLNAAYEEIKNRTGKTVNGIFIKD